jgi:hypothetical protein
MVFAMDQKHQHRRRAIASGMNHRSVQIVFAVIITIRSQEYSERRKVPSDPTERRVYFFLQPLFPGLPPRLPSLNHRIYEVLQLFHDSRPKLIPGAARLWDVADQVSFLAVCLGVRESALLARTPNLFVRIIEFPNVGIWNNIPTSSEKT